MLVRLVAAALVLASCGAGGTGSDDITAVAQNVAAAGPDCSTVVQLPEQDPVAEVRLVSFDARDGGFAATVEVQPLEGDVELRDVPRPIVGRASDAPYGASVVPAPPVAGVANAEVLTATVATPLGLAVVGGYPSESRSPLWLTASIPSLGTFACLMPSVSTSDTTTSTEPPGTTTSTTVGRPSAALLPGGPPTVTGTVGADSFGRLGVLENATDRYYEGMGLNGGGPVVVDATSSEQIPFSSLRFGDRVSVWVIGGCAESAPVQCDIAAVAVEPRE